MEKKVLHLGIVVKMLIMKKLIKKIITLMKKETIQQVTVQNRKYHLQSQIIPLQKYVKYLIKMIIPQCKMMICLK